MWDNLAILVRLDALLKMLRYGRGVQLVWGRGCNGQKVEQLLHRYGIPTYDQRGPNKRGERSVRVPAQQARWAEYLCIKAGVPLLVQIDPANRNVVQGKLPPDWGKPAPWAGFVGLVFRAFGALGK